LEQLTRRRPQTLAVQGNTLFVVNRDFVGKYDAITGEVINADFITGLLHPRGLAINGNTLFVVNVQGCGQRRDVSQHWTLG